MTLDQVKINFYLYNEKFTFHSLYSNLEILLYYLEFLMQYLFYLPTLIVASLSRDSFNILSEFSKRTCLRQELIVA